MNSWSSRFRARLPGALVAVAMACCATACSTVGSLDDCPTGQVQGEDGCGCLGGQLYDEVNEVCVCPAPATFDSVRNACTCPQGQTYDPVAAACVCDAPDQVLDVDGACTCIAPLVFGSNGQCGCPHAGEELIDGVCACPLQGQTLIDGACACPTPFVEDAVAEACACPMVATGDGIFGVPGETSACSGRFASVGQMGNPDRTVVDVAVLDRQDGTYVVGVLERTLAALWVTLYEVSGLEAGGTVTKLGEAQGAKPSNNPFESMTGPAAGLALMLDGADVLPIVVLPFGDPLFADIETGTFTPVVMQPATGWRRIAPLRASGWADTATGRSAIVFYGASTDLLLAVVPESWVMGYATVTRDDAGQIGLDWHSEWLTGSPDALVESSIAGATFNMLMFPRLSPIASGSPTFLAAGLQSEVRLAWASQDPTCKKTASEACIRARSAQPVVWELEYSTTGAVAARPGGNLPPDDPAYVGASQVAFTGPDVDQANANPDAIGFIALAAAGAAQRVTSAWIPVYVGCVGPDGARTCNPELPADQDNFVVGLPQVTGLTHWDRDGTRFQATGALVTPDPLLVNVAAVDPTVLGASSDRRMLAAVGALGNVPGLLLVDGTEGVHVLLHHPYEPGPNAYVMASGPLVFVETKSAGLQLFVVGAP